MFSFRCAAPGAILTAYFVLPFHLFSMSAAQQTIAPQAAPTQPSTGPTEIVLHSNANLVLLDVVVTSRGGPVHGLKASQFQLLEDGKPQTVTSFEEHSVGALPQPYSSSQGSPWPLPPGTYTNRPETGPAGAAPPAVNVLLLDALNTPIGDQMQVRRQLLEYLKKIPPGTHMAIFTLASRLRMALGFTTDAGLLAKTIANAKNGPQQSLILDPQSDILLSSSITGLSTAGLGNPPASGLDPIATMMQFQADVAAFQTDQRVAMTMDAMQQLARYLAAIPGRKNLIWFSGSFPITLLADDTLPDPFQSARYYSDALLETDNLLSAARVAVYPVDARGLMINPVYDASYSTESNLMGPSSSGTGKRGSGRSAGRASGNNGSTINKAAQAADQQRIAEQQSMQQIASETGGHAFLNNNDLAGALARAMEDGENYYTLGYALNPDRVNGRFHKLSVKLSGEGYELAYRPGFYAEDPQHPKAHAENAVGASSMMISASVHGAPSSSQIVFQTRIVTADDSHTQPGSADGSADKPAGEMAASLKGPVRRVNLEFKIEARDLTFSRDAAQSSHAKVELVIIAFDADGKRINYSDKGIGINLPAARFDSVTRDGLPLRAALDLPQGQVFLRVAVHDLISDRVGSLEIPLTIAPKANP